MTVRRSNKNAPALHLFANAEMDGEHSRHRDGAAPAEQQGVGAAGHDEPDTAPAPTAHDEACEAIAAVYATYAKGFITPNLGDPQVLLETLS